MITLYVLINGKLEIVNFCNIFYIFELKYNLLLFRIIEKAGYLILAKKEKMRVFDNNNNIVPEFIRIQTSY